MSTHQLLYLLLDHPQQVCNISIFRWRVSRERVDEELTCSLWAEAREMGRIVYRRIGMGETKMVWQNGKMDREEGGEIWAEAREMGRIQYRRIGMGETKMV